MVVNSRERAPKPKNSNTVVQTNVFMVEHSLSQSSLFFLLALFQYTQLTILFAYVKENSFAASRLCSVTSLIPAISSKCLPKVLGISTSRKCEYQSGSLLIWAFEKLLHHATSWACTEHITLLVHFALAAEQSNARMPATSESCTLSSKLGTLSSATVPISSTSCASAPPLGNCRTFPLGNCWRLHSQGGTTSL